MEEIRKTTGPWTACTESPVCDACRPCTTTQCIVTRAKLITPSPAAKGRRNLLTFERRIVEIRLGNVGAVGEINPVLFEAFAALEVLDMTSDPTLPNANHLTLAKTKDGATSECAQIPSCTNGAHCKLDSEVPVCDERGLPPGAPSRSATVDPALAAGASVGTVVGLLALCGASYYYVTAESRRRRAKKKSREKKLRQAERRVRRAQEEGMPPDARDLRVLERAASSRGGESSRSLTAAASSRSLGKVKSFKKTYQPRGGPGAGGATWSQAIDYASGATYYINNVTGQFQWERPPPGEMISGAPGLRGPPAPPSASPFAPPQFARGAFGAAPGGFGSFAGPPGGGFAAVAYGGPMSGAGGAQWEEVYDSSSDSSYWINSATGEFSWTNPNGRF